MIGGCKRFNIQVHPLLNMGESEEIERYKQILENLEDLAQILDILHTEVSTLKESVIEIKDIVTVIQKNNSDSPSINPMFG